MSEPVAPRFSLQRRERLMDELRTHGSVGVRDVAARLGVSELTIRRDINLLAQQGLVSRVHGGATLRSSLDRTPVNARDAVDTRYTLGMVVPSLDYYWPQAISGARAAAHRLHARIVLRGSSYDGRDDRKQIQALVDTPGVHGLVVAPDTSGPHGRALLQWLDALPIPVVLAERRAPEDLVAQTLESVSTDHAFGAGLAVRHLADGGHRRIAVLTADGSPTSVHVERGCRRALAALGLEPSLVADAIGFNSADRESTMDGILERARATGTTALLIHSDPEAVAFVQHLVDRGVRVPEDMAVVAYDDEVAHLGQPAVTAVRPPKQYVGRIAVELLLARLEEGAKRPAHHTVVNPELIVRESSV
jgi:DNA-binding LacI/PurR family transcriptional regulator